MTSKNRLEVRIAGKDYKLVGIESEEYIQKLALYIDKKMLIPINFYGDYFMHTFPGKPLIVKLK
jgi:hypothetical protein